MAILGTKPVEKTGTSGSPVAKTERKKTLTQWERFDAFIADVATKLPEATKQATLDVLNSVVRNHAKPKKDASTGRGLFFQIFGKAPKVGDRVSPNEVLDRTDGKGALTETILKRWEDPSKGVPYGNKATAKITFHRRDRNTGAEAYYSLDAFTPAGVDLDRDENGLS